MLILILYLEFVRRKISVSEFEIHIPARKKQATAEKDAAVKVTGEAYNALTEMQDSVRKYSIMESNLMYVIKTA